MPSAWFGSLPCWAARGSARMHLLREAVLRGPRHRAGCPPHHPFPSVSPCFYTWPSTELFKCFFLACVLPSNINFKGQLCPVHSSCILHVQDSACLNLCGAHRPRTISRPTTLPSPSTRLPPCPLACIPCALYCVLPSPAPHFCLSGPFCLKLLPAPPLPVPLPPPPPRPGFTTTSSGTHS